MRISYLKGAPIDYLNYGVTVDGFEVSAVEADTGGCATVDGAVLGYAIVDMVGPNGSPVYAALPDFGPIFIYVRVARALLVGNVRIFDRSKGETAGDEQVRVTSYDAQQSLIAATAKRFDDGLTVVSSRVGSAA